MGWFALTLFCNADRFNSHRISQPSPQYGSADLFFDNAACPIKIR